MHFSNSQRSRCLLAVSIALIVVARVEPAPYGVVAKWLVLILLSLKCAIGAPGAIRRIASQRHARRPWLVSLWHAVPDAMRALLRVEFSTYQETLCVLTRRPLLSVEHMANYKGGGRFTLHAGSLSTIFVPLLVMSTLAELPLLHLAIHSYASEQLALRLHWVLAGLTLWALWWAVGDRSAVKHMPHVLLPDEVILHVGFRSSCHLALPAIQRVQIVSGKPRHWMHSLGLSKSDVATLTPMDPPSLLFELESTTQPRHYTRFGVRTVMPRYLCVYVDKAQNFADAIVAAQRTAA